MASSKALGQWGRSLSTAAMAASSSNRDMRNHAGGHGGGGAPEHAGQTQLRWDPECRLRKASDQKKMEGPGAEHTRDVDVASDIILYIPADDGSWSEYTGSYLGHGQSKTVFLLTGHGKRFHGMVLKVARQEDMEPAVFTCATEHGIALPIQLPFLGNFTPADSKLIAGGIAGFRSEFCRLINS